MDWASVREWIPAGSLVVAVAIWWVDRKRAEMERRRQGFVRVLTELTRAGIEIPGEHSSESDARVVAAYAAAYIELPQRFRELFERQRAIKIQAVIDSDDPSAAHTGGILNMAAEMWAQSYCFRSKKNAPHFAPWGTLNRKENR